MIISKKLIRELNSEVDEAVNIKNSLKTLDLNSFNDDIVFINNLIMVFKTISVDDKITAKVNPSYVNLIKLSIVDETAKALIPNGYSISDPDNKVDIETLDFSKEELSALYGYIREAQELRLKRYNYNKNKAYKIRNDIISRVLDLMKDADIESYTSLRKILTRLGHINRNEAPIINNNVHSNVVRIYWH